jgi:hypothetical protein
MSEFAARYRSVSRLRLALPLAAVLAFAAPSVVGAQAAAPAHAAKSTTKWTKISSDTDLGIVSPGLFRTGDGRLHVIWPRKDGNFYSLHYSTVGGATKLLATGTVVSHWGAIAMSPRLMPGKHGGLQLLLDGGNGVSGSPYNTGAAYLARSNEAGKSWALVPGSLAHTGFVPLTDTAAATEPNGTPVAAWSEVTSLAYHVGIDPTSPATSPDQHLGIGAAGGLTNPTLITTTTGKILAAWFNNTGNSNEGYWAAQIWPSQGPKIKAPNSGGPKQTNGQPLAPVALVAHPGGGSYLAYCVPTHLHCSHIALWRVGAAKTLTVPGSSSGQAIFVTIAAGHGGHLWISWFDTGTNKISVVRTNAAANRFGAVRTISAPSPLSDVQGLFSEGGSGPLDVIALATLNHQGATPAYFDTELFPALRIHASKSSVSNQHSTTITFTVVDSGDAVPGVTVKFLGNTAKTNSKGVAKFIVKKGTAKGKHTAAATKSGYAPATVTVKVT